MLNLNFLKQISLLILIVFCSGCFEIVEEVTLKPNHSGDISITFNASRSKDKIKQVMLLDQVNGVKVPSISDIKAEVARQKSKLNAQSGISNVKVSEDYENFIFTASCHFKDAQSLEQAIITLLKNSKHKSVFDLKTGNFVYKNKTLTRKINLPKQANHHAFSDQQKGFLKDASYTSVYRFPGAVYKNTNAHARVSPNKKAVMFRSSVLEILENHKSPNLYIQHK